MFCFERCNHILSIQVKGEITIEYDTQHWRSQWGQRNHEPLKFLENKVILCFEKRFSKQNSVIRLKSNIPPQFWAGYTTDAHLLFRAFDFNTFQLHIHCCLK